MEINMNTIRYRALALAPLIFFFACAAPAQPPTESQMRDNADAQDRMQAENSVRENQRKYFATLDRNNKGYLNTDDVSADPFLTQNWAKCDVDHDGKLTLQEYMSCTHNNPPPAQR
jgi:hypothetical protein